MVWAIQTYFRGTNRLSKHFLLTGIDYPTADIHLRTIKARLDRNHRPVVRSLAYRYLKRRFRILHICFSTLINNGISDATLG